jgi:hypothetical protein
MASVICECGCLLLHGKNLKRHQQTQKHKQLLQIKNNTNQIKKISLKDILAGASQRAARECRSIPMLFDIAASILQAYARAKIDANDLQPAIFSDLFQPSVSNACL